MALHKSHLSSIAKKMYWKAFQALHEKTHHAHGYPVHYLYQPGKSNVLLIVFSAFAPDLFPTYNYVRTLWNKTDCHLLFIKDDFVHQLSGGCYYIGCNRDYHGLDAVYSLIQTIKERSGATHLIGIGSSKGGTAALLFGMKIPFNTVIIGSCQYAIGSYLMEHKRSSLEELTGKIRPDSSDIAYLDQLLHNAIAQRTSDPKPTIYFHYSIKEHTYQEHIKDLLFDLREHGFQLIEDIAEYDKHTDVSIYYLPYLKKTLREILTNTATLSR